MRQLQNHGFVTIVRRSSNEQSILLAPDILINLALSLMLKAQSNERVLGSLEEARTLRDDYHFQELEALGEEERSTLLHAAVELFLSHNICFRESVDNQTFLIFPSLILQRSPHLTQNVELIDDMTYIVTGQVENVYAALVVLLGYAPSFQSINQWHNQAQYETARGEICGFKLTNDGQGEIELVLYYGQTTPDFVRARFQGLFEEILYTRSVTVTKYPPSDPALIQAAECLRITRQHPEQTFICFDRLLRNRAEGALIWLGREQQLIRLGKEQRQEDFASIARGLHQLMRAEENRLEIIENLQDVLGVLQPIYRHYIYGDEVTTFLELGLCCLECRTMKDISSQQPWQKFEALKEPFLLSEVIKYSYLLAAVRDQAIKYFVRTDRREKELLLTEMLHTLDRSEISTNQSLYPPYQQLALHISHHWQSIVFTTLGNLHGQVVLKVRLLSEASPYTEVVEVGFEVSNLGDETAEEISLHIDDTIDYQVVRTDPPVDYLAPGASATLSCVLQLSHVRTIRLVINLNFRQRGIEGLQTIQFADVLRFVDQVEYFPFVTVEMNPYVTGDPLQTDDVFFGREQLIDDLESNLQGKYQDNSLVLYGQRRTGKTSLLYALQRRLSKERYIPVLYNAEGVDSPPSLFWGLANQIYDVCAKAGITLSQPALDQYTSYATAQFENNFLHQVLPMLGMRHLLLMIDEFESLEDAVKDKLLPKSIFSFLRKTMQNQRQLSFIFCGTHQLQELTRQYWQIFFNAARPFHITFLDESATKSLIQEPVRGHFTYDELALLQLFKLTGGNPYFTQLLCHSMVSLMNKQHRGYVTCNEVDIVAHQLIHSGNDHLDYIWNESGPAEQAILLSLAEELQHQRKVEVLWELVEARLSKHPLVERFSNGEARSSLERRELISIDDSRTSFTMGLIPIWLNTHHTWSDIYERKRR